MPYDFIMNENFPIVLERENIAKAYPLTPETAEDDWLNEQNTYKLLRKMIMQPGRTWTIRI